MLIINYNMELEININISFNKSNLQDKSNINLLQLNRIFANIIMAVISNITRKNSTSYHHSQPQFYPYFFNLNI